MRRFALPLIFLALAAGTVVAYRFAVPASPDRALAAAFAKVRVAEHLSGVVSVAMLLPRAEAAADAADDRTPIALRGAFKLDMPAEGRPSADVAFAVVGDGETEDIRVDVRTLADGTAYLKTEHLPDGKLGTLSLQGLNGTWWSLDTATLGWMLAAKDASTSDAGRAAPAQDASVAWRRLRDLALGGSMFVTDGSAVRERVGAVMTYRITLGVSREAAEAFVKDLRAALLGRELDAAEAAAAAKDADAHAVRVTVWVEPRTGTLAQVQIELESADGFQAMQTVLLEALDTGTPADVRAPESSKPFLR